MDNGVCDGNLVVLSGFNFENGIDFYDFCLLCLLFNINYYILVDGLNQVGDFGGVFGLQVWDVGVLEGGDLCCDVMDLGVVLEGGSVSMMGQVFNFCVDDVQDLFLFIFVSQYLVWFSFVVLLLGYVIIEGILDMIEELLGVQLVFYCFFNNICIGFFSYVISQYIFDDLDEMMEVICLFLGCIYFILVDGLGSVVCGIFELLVIDVGDIMFVED